MIGTGSYVVRTVEEKKMVLTPNVHAIHRKNAPQKLTFIKVPSSDETKKLLLEKKVDIGLVNFDGNPSDFDLVQKTYKYLQATILQFNTDNSFFSHAKNRCSFAEKFYKAGSSIPNKWEPISVGLPFAWNLFQKSEKSTNSNITHHITIDFADSASTFEPEFVEKLKVGLGDSSINLTFRQNAISELFQRLNTGDFEVALWGYAPDYFSPDALLTPLIATGQQYNYSNFSDASVDSLLEVARTVDHKRSRLQIYQKIFGLLGEKCPVAYLGSEKGYYVISKKLQVSITSLGYHTIKFRDAIVEG